MVCDGRYLLAILLLLTSYPCGGLRSVLKGLQACYINCTETLISTLSQNHHFFLIGSISHVLPKGQSSAAVWGEQQFHKYIWYIKQNVCSMKLYI